MDWLVRWGGTRIVSYLGLLSVLWLIPAPSVAIELTPVRHLFDIRHDFSQPSDVAVSTNGMIYVVDGVNQCIKVFDGSGNFLFSFGEEGDGPGQFRYPLGMAIDGSGRLYVADSGNGRLQIFTDRGDFIRQIRLSNGHGAKAVDPTDVVVDSSATMAYVVDNDNHCILQIDLESGKQVATLGSAGTERMEFRYPFLVTMYRDKYLYVVDVVNTRVQEFTVQGKFVRFIGDWGVEAGQFFRPKGVAVDSKGRVFVSDSYMGVIQVFDEEGIFHSVVGGDGDDALWRYTSPMGLYIDQQDRLYVTEMFAERVSVFELRR